MHRDSDEEKRSRRWGRLRLPMVPLALEGYVAPPDDHARWHKMPVAAGVGARGEHVAVWSQHGAVSETLVTWHGPGGRPVASMMVRSALDMVGFVQPMPDGGVLIASVRRPHDAVVSAERWSAQGALIAQADFGDAIEHVLVTESGAVWVGYFDEALTGREPEGHGLVRFGKNLEPEWRYPWNTDLPSVDDCEALNVSGETVHACPYSAHHLISVTGQEVTDCGPAPHRGGQALLIEGKRAVLIGGYGPDYDLITPFELTNNGPTPVGGQGRLVMPDGLEVHNTKWACRGDQGWAQIGAGRYRLTLQDVFNALC